MCPMMQKTQEILSQSNLEIESGDYISDEKTKAIVVGYNFINPEKSKDLLENTNNWKENKDC